MIIFAYLTTERAQQIGGNYDNGSNDGLAYWNLNNAVGNSNNNIGARLYL